MPKRYYETAVYVEEFNASLLRWQHKKLYREAAVRQIDKSGIFPGSAYQLRIPRDEDPETGGPLDVDGDRSLERAYIHGADSHIDAESITFTGYQPLENEDGHYTGKLILVKWHQIPYRWVASQDKERAANIELGKRLSEREQQILVALRTEAVRLDKEKPFQHTTVLVPSDGEEVQIGGIKVGRGEIEGLQMREGAYLIGVISDRSRDYHTRPPRDMTEVYLYSTGETIADHFLGRNDA